MRLCHASRIHNYFCPLAILEHLILFVPRSIDDTAGKMAPDKPRNYLRQQSASVVHRPLTLSVSCCEAYPILYWDEAHCCSSQSAVSYIARLLIIRHQHVLGSLCLRAIYLAYFQQPSDKALWKHLKLLASLASEKMEVEHAGFTEVSSFLLHSRVLWTVQEKCQA